MKTAALALTVVLMTVTSCVGPSYTMSKQAQANSRRLLSVEVGMPVDQVVEIMGEGTSYVSNPYRSQSRELLDGEIVLVLHFYTEFGGPSRALIPPECFTPMVFKDGHLMGWGRQFFEEYIEKHEIRFR